MSEHANQIEIHLSRPEQLYNLLDPSPFHDRDLDEKAERYIVGYARELKAKGPLAISVTLPQEACDTPFARHIPNAINNYFTYRADQTKQDLRELLKLGWRFLGIGLIVLASCFLAIQAMNLPENPTPFQRLVEQSLVILGWVANWRPIEIFLYDWLPLWRKSKLFIKLAAAQVTVNPG
jgi:hypothetical protein